MTAVERKILGRMQNRRNQIGETLSGASPRFGNQMLLVAKCFRDFACHP